MQRRSNVIERMIQIQKCFSLHWGLGQRCSRIFSPELLILAREDYNSLHREVWFRHRIPSRASWTFRCLAFVSFRKLWVWFSTPRAPRTNCPSICGLFCRSRSAKVFNTCQICAVKIFYAWSSPVRNVKVLHTRPPASFRIKIKSSSDFFSSIVRFRLDVENRKE